MTTFKHPVLDRQIDPEVTAPTAPPAILHGYAETQREQSDVLILSDYVLNERDVPEIVDWLCEHGINRVAVTSGSSALKRILWAFWQADCTFSMREVPHTSYDGAPQVATIIHI